MKPRKQLGDKNTVGDKITKLRVEADKMKQRELLAQMQVRGINISASALSDIEGQKRKVSGEELKVIAEIFQISVDELLR